MFQLNWLRSKAAYFCATLIFAFSIPSVGVADEIPEAVKTACRGDYIQYCSDHTPGTPRASDCMADAFDRLSDTCVSAILSSDLVGGPEVEEVTPAAAPPAAVTAKSKRRTASKRAKTRKAAKSRSLKRNRRTVPAKRARRYAKPRSRKARIRRVHRKIKRGLRIADRAVSRALRRAFR